MSQPVILIPARLASTRLEKKPLAQIGGMPMILHTWARACEADAGPVIVATDTPEIAALIEEKGGKAILTDPELPSGSDRIYAALSQIDPDKKFDIVVNLQGDLPLVKPDVIKACLRPMENQAVDISTAAAEITDESERTNHNIVKVIGTMISPTRLRALYFSRATAPWGDGVLYNHIGLYAFRREALEKFVRLPASTLEKRERLEQLRALEDGMRIDVELVPTAPIGVDTAADLEKVRAFVTAFA